MTIKPAIQAPAQPRPRSKITAAQLADIQSSIGELGYTANASYVLLADLDGQDVTYWCRLGDIDSATIAALSAGDFLASLTIGETLGCRGTTRTIIQEHDGYLVLIMQLASGHILLMVTGDGISLGFARLTMRRSCDEITTILSAPLLEFPRPTLVAEFERALLRSAP